MLNIPSPHHATQYTTDPTPPTQYTTDKAYAQPMHQGDAETVLLYRIAGMTPASLSKGGAIC